MPSIWNYLFGSKTAAKPENEENIKESVVKVENEEWVVFEESPAVDVKSQPIFAPTLSASFEQIRNNSIIQPERLSTSDISSAGKQSTPVIESPPPATPAPTPVPTPRQPREEQALAVTRAAQNQELINAFYGELNVDTTKYHNKADVTNENKRRDRMTKYPAIEKKARHATGTQQRGHKEKKHGKVQKNKKL